MKIPVNTAQNPIELIRRAGYGKVRDSRATEASWSRRLGDGIYPRFHAYINGQTINLHLDQKQASYEGSSSHSGEYDSEVVMTEGDRINGVMNQLSAEKSSSSKPAQIEEKKGFWGSIFGN